MKKFLIVLMMFGFSLKGNTTTKTSVANSSWSTATTWSPSGVPAAGDIVIINSNVSITANTKKLAGLTINSGHTLTNSGSTLLINYTATSNFINNGTYTDNSGTVTLTGNFTNNGTRNDNSSTFTLTGNFINNGTYTNSAGTTNLTGNFTNSSGTYTNSGTIKITGNFTNSTTFSNGISGVIKLTGSLLNSAGTFTDAGTTTITSGNFTNNTTYLHSAGTLTITGNIINLGTYTNSAGTITLTGNLTDSIGIFTNGGSIKETGNFTNYSSFSNSTSGIIKLTGSLLNNAGTFSDAGTTTITSGGFTNNTTYTNNSGTITLTGNFTNNGIRTDNSTTFTIVGNIINLGTYTNNSGITNLTGNFTNSTGTYTNNGSITETGGNFTNYTTFSNNASGIFTVTGNFTNNAGTFTNAGTTTITGTLTNNSTFSNNTTSSLTLTGNLINSGTFTNASNITLSGSLINSLNFSNNTGILTLTGNFTNTGTYTDNSGAVTFNGTSTQTVSGKLSFYDLTIDGNGPITTSDSIWVKDALTLTKGILNVSSGILTLQNDAVYNGRVVSVGTGNITGTFLAEKWVSRCNALWSSYGSCVGQAINTLNLYTTGFTGCPYYPSYSWVNMYTYLESAAGSFSVGYTAPTSTSEVLGRGVGFIYWFSNYTGGDDFPRILPMKGTLDFQTAFTFPITVTNNSTAANIGWNLVSNPFPGTISWTASGWTKTKMNNAEYMWNTCSSVYASYVSGVSTNGGSQYIPEGQGFFVHAKKTTSKLKATSAVIVNNTSQQLLTPSNPDSVNNVLKIDLGVDEIAIRLDSAASDQNDSLFDASEIISDSTRLYSYVYSDTSDIYSINSVKDTDQVIPVNIRKSGTLTFSGITTFQGQYTIYLKDLLNGSYQQIFDGFTYPFTDTTTSSFQTRFEIHFSKIITTGINQIAKNNSATINYDLKNIYVNFNFANPQTTQIIIYNLLGQELQRVDGTFYQEKNYIISRPDVPVIVELLNSNTKVVRKVF